jgi:hypothetical protein
LRAFVLSVHSPPSQTTLGPREGFERAGQRKKASMPVTKVCARAHGSRRGREDSLPPQSPKGSKPSGENWRGRDKPPPVLPPSAPRNHPGSLRRGLLRLFYRVLGNFELPPRLYAACLGYPNAPPYSATALTPHHGPFNGGRRFGHPLLRFVVSIRQVRPSWIEKDKPECAVRGFNRWHPSEPLKRAVRGNGGKQAPPLLPVRPPKDLSVNHPAPRCLSSPFLSSNRATVCMY